MLLILLSMSILLMSCELENVSGEGLNYDPFSIQSSSHLFMIGSDSTVFSHAYTRFSGNAPLDVISENNGPFGYSMGIPFIEKKRGIDVTLQIDLYETRDTVDQLFYFGFGLEILRGREEPVYVKKMGGNSSRIYSEVVSEASFSMDSNMVVSNVGKTGTVTYSLKPIKQLCAGIYDVGYETDFAANFDGIQVGLGGGGVWYLDYYIDGDVYCDSVEREQLPYVDVNFNSGSIESAYSLEADSNFAFWEIIKYNGLNVHLALTSFDSALVLSSLEFLEPYAGKEGSNLDSYYTDLFLLKSLELNTVEIYSDTLIRTGNELKGDLAKYFIYNDYQFKYKYGQIGVFPNNHITLNQVGQQFLIRTSPSQRYVGVVQSIDRAVPGSEKVVIRFYRHAKMSSI